MTQTSLPLLYHHVTSTAPPGPHHHHHPLIVHVVDTEPLLLYVLHVGTYVVVLRE